MPISPNTLRHRRKNPQHSHAQPASRATRFPPKSPPRTRLLPALFQRAKVGHIGVSPSPIKTRSARGFPSPRASRITFRPLSLPGALERARRRVYYDERARARNRARVASRNGCCCRRRRAPVVLGVCIVCRLEGFFFFREVLAAGMKAGRASSWFFWSDDWRSGCWIGQFDDLGLVRLWSWCRHIMVVLACHLIE